MGHTIGLHRKHRARLDGLAVDVHRAGAAQAGAAAEFCARELELLAHDPEQRRVGLSLDVRRLAIDCE